MTQIEDLSNQIMNSAFFQQMLKNQVEKCTKRLSNDSPPYESDSTHLSDILKQINGYLIEITELALEEENSHNYIAFMNKTQQMCRELQRKIEIKLFAKIETLSLHIQRLQIKLNQAKNNQKIGQETSKLQDERKIITQQILQSSRKICKSQNNMDCIKNKSPTNQKSHHQMLNTNDQQIKYSIKLIQMQQSNSRSIINELQKKLQRTIERLAEQHIQLEKRQLTLKQYFEEGLSTSLQGIWNVLSDLSNRIIKFQSRKQTLTVYRK